MQALAHDLLTRSCASTDHATCEQLRDYAAWADAALRLRAASPCDAAIRAWWTAVAGEDRSQFVSAINFCNCIELIEARCGDDSIE